MHETNAEIPVREKVLEMDQSNRSSDVAPDDDHHAAHALNWLEVCRVLFVAATAAVVWFAVRPPGLYIIAAGVVCTLVGGFPIFHEAYENITERRMTMELSMAIAIVAALAIREIFTALVITLFVLVAEILEGLTVGRGAGQFNIWLIFYRTPLPSGEMVLGKK